MLEKSVSPKARIYALIALIVFIVSEILSSLVFGFTEGNPYYLFVIIISIDTIIMWWVVPLLIIYKIERRNIQSLGLLIPHDKKIIYAIYATSTLVIPAIIVKYDSYYPIEFIEQVLYIGLAEELFYRGFMMTRMCQWLGKYKGLLATSLIFGFAHVISRIADNGLDYVFPAISTGLQTLCGGLIFGYIYLRSKNIWPSAILHISTNMYLMDLIQHFSS